LPSALGICKPEEDKYYILAHYRVTGKMQAFEQAEMEKEANRRGNQAAKAVYD
jgi:hypothetical protein